jgi:hypothetical protein
MSGAFNGPGRYNAECTAAREACASEGAVLLVYNGRHGQGFEVQGPLEMIAALPRVLRELASQIEQQQSGGAQA